MHVFAPEQTAVKQCDSHDARELKAASGFFNGPDGLSVQAAETEDRMMRVEDRT